MSFPATFLPDELTPEAASELLRICAGEPVSPGLGVWLASVRGEVAECEKQSPMFGAGL